jgi:hypothetical protein
MNALQLTVLAANELDKAPWWIGLPLGVIMVGGVFYMLLSGKVILRSTHDELLAVEKARADGFKEAHETALQALAISEQNNASLIQSGATTVSLIEALRESMGHPR